MRILKLLPALLLFAAVAANAQDELVAPFEWKVQGDSVDTLKVSLNPSIELDRSSPTALVRTFLALSDGRSEVWPGLEGFESRVHELENSALKDSLSELPEPLREAPALVKKANGFGGNWEIEETKSEDLPLIVSGPDGKLEVVKPGTSILIVTRKSSEDDDPLAPSRRAFRFTCKARVGLPDEWEIEKLETLAAYRLPNTRIVWGDESRLSLAAWWKAYDPGYVLLARLGAAMTGAGVEADDAMHPVVRSFFEDILLRRLMLRTRAVAAALGAHLHAVEPLFSPELVASLRKAAEESMESGPTLSFSISQIEQRQLGEGRLGVLIRKGDYFNTSWLFELRKDGEGWRVEAIKQRFVATRVRDGQQVETLRDVGSYWEVAKQEAPSVLNIPMFMPR
ncbi:MAG: hypothetical protein H6841_10945 [Planctomycetes bacterium]|nr:hypothetical protein [Planctomycetota bacterium]MCB9935802.1 hypothetical protein [Planctomycetota bacterium]